MSSTSLDDTKSTPSLGDLHAIPVQKYDTGDLSLKRSADVTVTSTGEFISTLSEAEQRRIWRKLDLRLLPFVSLLYLFSFL